MADIRHIGDAAPTDARHATVDDALDRAGKDHAEEPASRAVVILARVENGALRLRPFCAGVEMTQAIGLLELAKHELLYGGED